MRERGRVSSEKECVERNLAIFVYLSGVCREKGCGKRSFGYGISSSLLINFSILINEYYIGDIRIK